jgi:tetratricopeptide (TPR) repeat protein
MGLIPTILLEGRSLAHRQRLPHSVSSAEKVIELSSWMMVLGTIRLICAVADYAQAYLEATRLEPLSLRRLGWFFQENHPIVVLGAAWPLILGLVLRRTRWPELLKAGAATFLILSIGGILALTAGWNQSLERWITVGSFRMPRPGLGDLSVSDVMLGLLGATQLVLEFGTAVRAIHLVLQRSTASEPAEKHAAARRARCSRLALYTSAAYLVLMIRLPVWSAYLEVLNQSAFVREFILKSDIQRIRSTRRFGAFAPESQQMAHLQSLLATAVEAWGAGRFLEAKANYLRLAAFVETIPASSMSAPVLRGSAEGLNNLAWLLATCPEVELRDPRAAVTYARRAIDLIPTDGNSWNSLGVAYYRAHDWDEALSALYRSMELREEGDSFDWFFLAMIHARLGHPERARQWYDKATQWFGQNRPGDAELYRFQIETAESLGLPKPAPPKVERPVPSQVNPEMILRRRHSRIIDPAIMRP